MRFLVVRALLRFAVLEGYGQTECTAAATVTSPSDCATLGHVGGPVPCNQIKLVSVPGASDTPCCAMMHASWCVTTRFSRCIVPNSLACGHRRDGLQRHGHYARLDAVSGARRGVLSRAEHLQRVLVHTPMTSQSLVSTLLHVFCSHGVPAANAVFICPIVVLYANACFDHGVLHDVMGVPVQPFVCMPESAQW